MGSGYTLDYFVGELRCPVCGNVSPADGSTNMQTRIRDEPELAYLGVGDRVEVHPDKMYDKGYYTVRPPKPGEEIRILDVWECPNCGAPFNWAEVVIRDGTIQAVAAVPLTREILERAHYISTEVVSVAGDLASLSPREMLDQDPLRILYERLPGGST